MKFYNLILLIFLSFISQPTLAFLNIESLRQTKHYTEKLKGSTQVGISDSNGNVNKTILNFSSLNMMNLGKSNYILLGSYNYGRSTQIEDVNDGHLHFRYTRLLREGLFGEVYQQTEFDKFQDLNARYLLGTGLRQKLFQKSKHSLFLGAGAFYEKEELQDSPNQDNPRGNLYLSYVFSKSNDYNASVVTYYQPNTENFSDHRFRFNLGLETFFGENFVQQWEYSLSRDNNPPIGIQRTDSKVTAQIGLTY